MPALNIKYKVKNNKLNLSGLNLTEIPVKEIAQLNVTHLDLSNNKIVSTDNVFTSLPGLVKLDLSGNRIKSVCGDIGSLQKLAYLSLANNEIQELPKGMIKLKQLTHLSLDNNPLKSELAEFVGPSQNNAQCRTAAANAIRYLKGDHKKPGKKNKKSKASDVYPQNNKPRNKTVKNAGVHLFEVFQLFGLLVLCILLIVVLTDAFLYVLTYKKSNGTVKTNVFRILTSATSYLFQKTCNLWIVANPSVQQYIENVHDSWQSLWDSVFKRV